MCLSWAFIWFSKAASSPSIIDSQSFIASSDIPSRDNRDRSFFVEITMFYDGVRSTVDNLGNLSLAAKRDSIHEALSYLEAANMISY